MAEPSDVQHLMKQLIAGASPEENRALLDALLSGQASSIFEKLHVEQKPTLRPVPTEVWTRAVQVEAHTVSAAGVATARPVTSPCLGCMT
ncbi:MAG TPA: hypothetical protein VK204_07460 [Nocardioidaceae bacterium]|nr:hypothetical protein [Nocardioidaceae bacterium]